MANLSLTPTVNDARGQAFSAIQDRMARIDLSPLLIYRLASVPAAILPYLAWQFDMLSSEWSLLLAGSTLEQLLANAIPLHKTLGTPYALKVAFAALGWPNATILEGQNAWGGSSWPSNQGWAVFRVQWALAIGQAPPADLSSLAAAATFFKPARCWLDALSFVFPPIEDSAPTPIDNGTTLSGAASVVLDTAPPPVDHGTSFKMVGLRSTDVYSVIAPLCNGHYFCTGHNCGANEPYVADGPVVVNGVAQNAI
ncbi:MAG TPA: phage tail protein [Candidatus Binataceae bacterium]|nr:phage tail protein [Candidatus Binataceae bacterium]